ncbi:hypothetical protein AKO1_007465 [Acrasis kona]|uniref:Piezo non-specific cation channel R-Ras-binding domain-containing protein n=1 Tax=Acrasis kona TaxID=1008807 RepID=A0AAW2YSQ4_9EUKA
MCYLAMVINLIVSPTIINALFTVVAFGFAGMQYPYPNKRYWEITLFCCMFALSLQYILHIVQKTWYSASVIENSLLRWIGSSYQENNNLFGVICTYLLIMLCMFHHRDVLKRRGDWVNWDENLEAELKRAEKKRRREELMANGLMHLHNDEEDTDLSTEEHQVEPNTKISHQLRRRSNSNRLSITISNNDDPSLINNKQRRISMQQQMTMIETSPDDHSKKRRRRNNNILVDAWKRLWTNTKHMVVNYFQGLVNEETKLGRDLFVVTVVTDIFGFLFFFFSFSYMSGRHNDGAITSITSNQLSGYFVMVLFLFFLEICVERVIYLKSSLKSKLTFHLAVVIAYHVVYLVMYDYISKMQNKLGVVLLNVLFMIKSFYMWVSCLQIKSGYPTMGIYTSFFVKSYFWVFNIVYLIWRAIPFVFELKTLLDWTFIKTTLNFYEWLKMEDIYSTLYTRKCDLEYKKILGRSFGKGQFYTTKLGSGFLLFVLICFVIFFPLLFYSTANPTFIMNSVTSVKIEIEIGGFRNIYQNQLSVQGDCDDKDRGDNIFDGCARNVESILNKYYVEKASSEVLKKHVRDDFVDYDSDAKVQAFVLSSYSEVYWTISTPSRLLLSDVLERNMSNGLDLRFVTQVTRLGPANNKVSSLVQAHRLSDHQRQMLSNMIKYPEKFSDPSFDLMFSSPYNPFMINKAQDGLSSVGVTNSNYYPNCTLGVRQDGTFKSNNLLYWNFNCSNTMPLSQSLDGDKIGGFGPFFFIQSGLISADSNVLISTVSSFGIITLYTSFVLTVGRFVRIYASGLVSAIHYEDLDNVDLLLSYTMDIYMAREAEDLELEEIMFVHLLRIYRDTSLIQIWTNTNKSTL